MSFALVFLKKSFFLPFLTVFLLFLTQNLAFAILINTLLHFVIAKIYFQKHIKLAFLQNRALLLKVFCIIFGYNVLILSIYEFIA